MGCCGSTEDDEDRQPVLSDAGSYQANPPTSDAHADAVASLKKSFAEADETARKNALLQKKEQQDRGTSI